MGCCLSLNELSLYKDPFSNRCNTFYVNIIAVMYIYT